MAEQIVFKIELDSEGLEKKISKTTSEIEKMKLETAQLNKTQKELIKTGQAESEQFKQNAEQIYKNNLEIQALTQTRKTAQKTLDAGIGTLAAERLELIALKTERDKIDKSTEEGAKKFDEMNQKILELNESIKRSEEAGGDFQRSVGDYKKALASAGTSIDDQNAKLAELRKIQAGVQLDTKEGKKLYAEIGKEIENTTESIEEMGGTGKSAFDKIAGGAESFGVSAEGLNSILKASPIFLVVGAVTALFGAFSKTTEGAKTLKVVTAGLNAGFQTVVGLLGQVGIYIQKAFEDPQKTLKDFGQFLIDNVVNRFKGILLWIDAVGGAMSDVANGDFENLKNRAKEAGQAMTQIATGLDKKQMDAIGDAVEGVAKKIKDQVEAGIELERQQQRLTASSRILSLEIAKLNAEYEIQTALADDDTKSFREQEQAFLKAAAAREKAGALQVKLNQQRLKQINDQVAIERKAGVVQDDLLDQQRDAQIELLESQKQLTLDLQENTAKRRKLTSDLVEQELDILIDGFDKTKTINEQKIADERLAYDERVKLFAETKRLADISLAEQLKSAERIAEDKIDIDDLVATSDANLLKKKLFNIGADEIARLRLFEVVRERQQIIADFAVIELDLQDELIARTKELSTEKLNTSKAEKTAEIERLNTSIAIATTIKDNDKTTAKERIKLNEEITKAEQEKHDKTLELIAVESVIKQNEIANEITSEEVKAEKLKQLNLETNTAIAEQNEEFRVLEAEKEAENELTRKELFQKRIDESRMIIDAAIELMNQYSEYANLKTENDLKRVSDKAKEEQALLDEQLAKGLISQEQFDAKTQQLKKKNDEDTEKIQRKAFERNKKMRIAEAIIDTAKAALSAFNSLASIPVVGAILGGVAAAAATAFGVLQVNEIRKQTFAEGGLVSGPSHAQGGVPFTVQGNGGYEMEGGEYIVRKSAVTKDSLPILEQINGKSGGQQKFFQDGGIVRQQGERMIEQKMNVSDMLKDVQIVVGVQDILSETGKVVRVSNKADM